MYKYTKRFFDILLSILGILIFFPFFIIIAICLLLTGEHHVFYLQERVGHHNKIFKIWKFATMLKASPSLGTGSITVKNDWRLTPMGRYLRVSKINEIPQLINIFQGEMTMVGPRPLMQFDFNKLPPDFKDKFYKIKPGLTGIASIVFRDEEKLRSLCNIDPHEFDRIFVAPFKGKLEMWYQQHCSIHVDILIVLFTIISIFYRKPDFIYRFFKDLPKFSSQCK